MIKLLQKFLLLTLLGIGMLSAQAQIKIRGSVVTKAKKPLIGASVYINGSTLGTSTDYLGEFELLVDKGSYEIVVSYVGYKTIRYALEVLEEEILNFTLLEDKNLLNEIVISNQKKIRKSKRKSYLKLFRKNFLGESKYATECQIVNESELKFSYNNKTKTLKAKASQPLRIINPLLGYVIYYDLIKFEYSINLSYTYKGFVRFEEISGSDKEKATWIENRKQVYLGSSMHFFHLVINERVRKEKFTVDLISRAPNPKYPTTEEIEKANEISGSRARYKRFYLNGKIIENPKEFAIDVFKRAKLPRLDITVLDENMKLFRYGFYDSRNVFLKFSNYLRVTYDGLPDKKFNSEGSSSEYQVSIIRSKRDQIILKKPGYSLNPGDIYLEGYWAFKRVGDLLPFNYRPTP